LKFSRHTLTGSHLERVKNAVTTNSGLVAPAKKQNSYEEPGALTAQPINGFFHNHKLRDIRDERERTGKL
jgi:hypothetical protein